jgi:hypothetical protein
MYVVGSACTRTRGLGVGACVCDVPSEVVEAVPRSVCTRVGLGRIGLVN